MIGNSRCKRRGGSGYYETWPGDVVQHAEPAHQGAKTLPLLNNYFKTAPMRQSGTTTLFGTEQIIDELAYAAKMDPIAFRRQNVSKLYTDRYFGVLNALQQAANWQPEVAASNLVEGD